MPLSVMQALPVPARTTASGIPGVLMPSRAHEPVKVRMRRGSNILTFGWNTFDCEIKASRPRQAPVVQQSIPLPVGSPMGGLISYVPDEIKQHRRATGYVDRILKGGKTTHLPIIQSTNLGGTRPEDRKDVRPHGASIAARPRRRGD